MSLMKRENHIVNHPLILLEFLQHVTKGSLTPVPLPFTFSFVIEDTYDSLTAIKAAWFNTVELTRIIEYLDGFNVSNANKLTLSYVEGLTRGENKEELFYEMHVTFEYFA